jgi:DNA repair photolyase
LTTPSHRRFATPDTVPPPPTPSHRGAITNPPNRFEHLSLEPDPDWYDPEERPVATTFYRDRSASALTYNDSPDVGFDVSLNPYRGCEHGCAYCYARPTHEYLGFSAGLDFESRIMVKEDAPELLRAELNAESWRPQTIALSGVTDSYQPIERRLRLTRRCLEVLTDCRNPVCIVTKNELVARDADLLSDLAQYHACAVLISLTTLNPDLRRRLEPRTSPPPARLRAIRTLRDAGVPVGVLLAPLIPAINDHEMIKLLAAAADHGAQFAGYVALRLPLAVEPLFIHWLDQHFPERRQKVLSQLRELREGLLNDVRFGSRMTGTGKRAEALRRFFHLGCRRATLSTSFPELSTRSFRRPVGGQTEFAFVSQ